MLVELLLSADDYITANELATKLSVSTKTIYRDIRKIINDKQGKLELIKKENLGYWFKQNQKIGQDISPVFSDPGERRIHLLLYLLVISPMRTSIQKLSEKYFVSQSSIINDFSHIERNIAAFDLILAKENSGTVILGEPLSKVRLTAAIIERFLQQNGDPFSQYAIPEFIQKTQIKNAVMRQIKNFLHHLQNKNEIYLDQQTYLTLFCVLLCTIERHLNFPQEDQKLKRSNLNPLGDLIVQAANTLIEEIESEYAIELNPDESKQLFYILESCNLKSEDSSENHLSMNDLSDRLIEALSAKSRLSLRMDDHLKRQLVQHLQAMAYRMKHDIYLINPILLSIKQNYSGTFHLVKESIAELINSGYLEGRVTDEEAGYITMYFQVSIDKYLNKIPVLIECISGIGTSHLLSEKIKKLFPMLEVKKIVAQKRIKDSDFYGIALIISTVNVQNDTNIPTIFVNPILNDSDKYKIDQFIDSYYREQELDF
ncbi:MAG: transcription antiterminator [Sporolactobacillus sp.]